MIGPVDGAAVPPAGPPPDSAAQRAKLRQAAHDLEGVFVAQLFQAMRATVPQDGILEQAPGQELFTQLLDERLATNFAERSRHGIGESLYRQLARRLDAAPAPAPATRAEGERR